MVIDSEDCPITNNRNLGERALQRTDVIGTPLAEEVFRLPDAIWLNDSRIAEVRSLSNEA